uniref:Ig-like domain-containing protein n=1 Tax=Gadus morhua TaxID=8049 RepID=A0A8C5CBK9_GADMO
MQIGLWVFLLLLTLISCQVQNRTSSSRSLTVRPGQPLTIRCQVSYSVSSYATAWIRQPDGKGLEWIGDEGNLKDSLGSKFSISVDEASNTATLQGQNMQPGDSAVYYCARRHSVTNCCQG